MPLYKTDNTDNLTNAVDDIFYIFLVHGSVPEFCDGLAFRYDKKRRSEPKKSVVCPYCGEEFEKVDINTKIEVFRCSNKSKAHHHKLRKCKMCYSTVGIKYA